MDTVINIGRLSSTFGHRKTLILDNTIFKLHYKLTVAFLMATIFCLSGNMWMGRPIDCMTSDSEDKQMMESHCLVEGAKTIHPKTQTPMFQPETIYPGVAPVPDNHPEYTLRWHHMYPWTMVALFIMAVINYFPHFLWKMIDGGRLHNLVQGMDKEFFDEDEARVKIRRTVKKISDFEESVTIYTISFVACEVINVVFCVAQMYFIHWLFNSELWEQQIEVIKDVFGTERSLPLLHEAFPKVIKCNFERYGPSGTVEILDAMCFFHQNRFNEVAFTLLWIWFFAIGVVSACHLAFNKIGFLMMKERINILHRYCPTADKDDVIKIVNCMTITQVVLLVELCKALQSLYTDDLLKELAKELKPKTSPKQYIIPSNDTIGAE